MIGWFAFAIMLVIFAGTLFWVRRRMSEEIARIEGAHKRRVAKLTSEADARTARVERASMAEAERRGVALAEDLLPVADAMRAAVAIDPSATAADLRAGVELASRELDRTFEAHGIVAVDPEPGEPFDPALHEAVEKTGDGSEVVRVHRIGWLHGDRVLRSALVGVGTTEQGDRVDPGGDVEIEEGSAEKIVETAK